MERDKLEKIAVLTPSDDRRRSALRGGATEERHGGRSRTGLSPEAATGDIWGRVNNDIATFLAAMDSLSTDDSDQNYEALLLATDRLLWASARTRLELERVLSNRKKGVAARRASG